jgi:hypothetical protein
MLSNEGLTGTLNTLKTERRQSVTLTIFTLPLGSQSALLKVNGIIVGKPEGSLLTLGIDSFHKGSG